MRHEALTHADYRKVVKDWVMKQDDNRAHIYSDYSLCIVGQFLKEHPEFYTEFGSSYDMNKAPNIWNSTHTDTYYDPVTMRVHSASEVLSKESVLYTALTYFSGAKEAMTHHPLWMNL